MPTGNYDHVPCSEFGCPEGWQTSQPTFRVRVQQHGTSTPWRYWLCPTHWRQHFGQIPTHTT